MDKLDELINEIKELVDERGYKIFKLEVGDIEGRQSFTRHITWEQYVKGWKNPSGFSSKTEPV